MRCRSLLFAAFLTVGSPRARAASLSDLAWRQNPGAVLPYDAPLVDDAGQTTTLRAASAGLPLVIVPGYFRCPNLCGTVRDDLLSALSRSGLVAGRDYALAAVTIDPAETRATAAAVRRDELSRFPLPGDESAIHYLTGLRQSLDAVAAAEGFPVRYDATLKQFMHPAGIVLATPDGIVSGYLLGVGFGADALRSSIGRARDGVSSLAQPVLLLCFHIDPTTGRYTLAIMKVLRLAAGLTVLTVGGTMWLLHRAGQRRARLS